MRPAVQVGSDDDLYRRSQDGQRRRQKLRNLASRLRMVELLKIAHCLIVATTLAETLSQNIEAIVHSNQSAAWLRRDLIPVVALLRP
jgi:hypothetical protein